MSATAALVPGPLHPDLFGGVSPIQVSAGDLRMYRVEIAPEGLEAAWLTLEVAAVNARQAHQFAAADYARRTGTAEHRLTLLAIDHLDAPPGPDDKRAYLARHGGKA